MVESCTAAAPLKMESKYDLLTEASHSLPHKTPDSLSSSNPDSTALKRKLIRGGAKVFLSPQAPKSHMHQPKHAKEQWREDSRLYALLGRWESPYYPFQR